MKIQMQKTETFYVFASPATVNKTENVVLQGLEGETLVISSINGKTAKKDICDGCAMVKPYELPHGQYRLKTEGKGKKETMVGSLVIGQDKATFSMVDTATAIKELAIALTESNARIEQNEIAIKALVQSQKIILG